MHEVVFAFATASFTCGPTILSSPFSDLAYFTLPTLVRFVVSRPCLSLTTITSFYCIILLTALFTSSCYWEPVPTHSLFQIIVPDVSPTAPLRYIPNATLEDQNTTPFWQELPIPKLTTMVDRCWCELSGGLFFEPFNGTSWQLSSLVQTLGIPDSRRVIVTQRQSTNTTQVWIFKTQEADEEELSQNEQTQPTSGWDFPSFSFIKPLRLFLFSSPKSESPPLPVLPNSTAAADSIPVMDSASQKEKGWSSIMPPYDLRRIGINAKLDLR